MAATQPAAIHLTTMHCDPAIAREFEYLKSENTKLNQTNSQLRSNVAAVHFKPTDDVCLLPMPCQPRSTIFSHRATLGHLCQALETVVLCITRNVLHHVLWQILSPTRFMLDVTAETGNAVAPPTGPHPHPPSASRSPDPAERPPKPARHVLELDRPQPALGAERAQAGGEAARGSGGAARPRSSAAGAG